MWIMNLSAYSISSYYNNIQYGIISFGEIFNTEGHKSLLIFQGYFCHSTFSINYSCFNNNIKYKLITRLYVRAMHEISCVKSNKLSILYLIKRLCSIITCSVVVNIGLTYRNWSLQHKSCSYKYWRSADPFAD